MFDVGVDKLEELKEIGVTSTLEAVESLVRELFCILKGMRSRVALILAKHILQLQFASFRQPGK